MTSREHILELSRKLDKAKNKSDAITVFKILESLNNADINIGLLKESKIGHTVNAIRKLESFKTSKQITELASALVQKWKDSVKTELNKHKKNSKSSHKNGKKNGADISRKKSENTANNSSKLKPEKVSKAKAKSKSPSIIAELDSVEWETGDEKRDRMIRKFIEALSPEENKSVYVHFVRLAADIEAGLGEEYGSNTQKYTQKCRDIHFNVKKNPDLKERLLLGNVSVEALVTMSTEKMAHRSLKEKRDKEKKWAMAEARNDHGLSVSNAMTDEFKCGKCKQRKCKYSQAQTRSADEPMTTFVTCLVCGNRWRF